MSNQEYLTQARKLLTEDYKTKHTDEYNIWLSKCKDSWMQPHVIVPFPPFIVSSALSPFKPSVSAPNEEAVIAKALELYNQFNPAPANVPTTPQPAPVAKQAPALIDELLSSPAVQIAIKKPVAEVIVEESAVEVEEPVAEPVVEELVLEESVAELVVEETIEETVVEEPVAEPVVEDVPKNTDAIYKIFQVPAVEEPIESPIADTLPPTIETALNAVPQPAEELAKTKDSGRILPSVLQKIQDLKLKWSSTGGSNV